MEFYGLKKLSSSCSGLHEACPYTLEQLLQKGKNSVRILKAYSSETNETVAIKLFPKNTEGRNLKAYLNEAAMISNLSHPHILNYKETYDDAVVGSANNNNFTEYSAILMDFVSNGDLYNCISQGSFSEKLARTIFKQILAAVGYLHNNDLAHLDLKLENFLVNEKEGVKLIDFESCQKIDEDTVIISKGTSGYRAPEMVEDRAKNAKALDMYALGVLLFILVAGTPPYTELNENGVWKFDKYYNALRNDSRKFWEAHEKYRRADGKDCFSKELKEIIENLLSVEPEKRADVNSVRRMRWMQGEVFNKEELERELSKYF